MDRKKAPLPRQAAEDKPATLQDRLDPAVLQELQARAAAMKAEEQRKQEEKRRQATEARKAEQKRLDNDFAYQLENSKMDWQKFK